ncbi:glycosyltransferase family 2 protein [Peribacillus sp. SCS-155]|uniref:glycosyltransferase family 2 protein n=1 Tax=Peribacillus sedimenti TaxID=3115297 RepID=UPI0039063E6B
MISSILQSAKRIISERKMNVINHPSSIKKKWQGNKKKVTVITAVYNAEEYIENTIRSVINQTIGFDEIEYIIVDDCSTDRTNEIVKSYTQQYPNICLVTLGSNTGSPGTPRNIGVQLATAKYVTFLDADDWFAEDGIERLYSILEETGDDYVVGKTVKYTSDTDTAVVGEFASVEERRSITPFAVPHFFYHMGPTARLIKLSLLKENEIGFPDIKFGEDKLFFSDVFFHANTVSTTTWPIYFVNRKPENSGSLTRVTDVLTKRRADLEVIRYIMEKQLPIEKEKAALTRIYEYDIVKTFDSQLFVKSDKKEEFIDILRQAMEMAKDLRYDILAEFKTPFYRRAVDLFMEGRIDDLINLFVWLKQEKNKHFAIKDGLPYYEVPLFTDNYRFIRVPMFARALDSYVINDVFHQMFEVYGEDIDNINSILIRDRKRFDNEIVCPFKLDGNFGSFKIPLEQLDALEDSLFTIFIRYNEYQLLNIKRILKNHISHNGRKVEFYTTKVNNLGLLLARQE